MQFFEASLGVGCEFCHSGAPDADTARKSKAREMVAMVRAINRETFNGARVVTCYTCHRGNARPLNTPSPASASFAAWILDSLNGAPDPTPVPGPPPADVLRTYVQSLGGDAALAKISTRVVSYTVTDAGGRVTNVERISKGDNGLMVTHGAMGDPMQYPEATMGWSGKAGWARSALGVRDIRDYEIPEAKLQDPVYVAVGLWADSGGHALQRKPRESVPADLLVRNRDRGFHWTVASAIGFSSINVVDLAQNTPVDDSRFARPPR